MKPAGIPRLSTFDPRSRRLLADFFGLMKDYDPVVLRGKRYVVVLFRKEFYHSGFFFIIGRNDGMKTNFAILVDSLEIARTVFDKIKKYPDYLQDKAWQASLVAQIVRSALGLNASTMRAQGDLVIEVNPDIILRAIFHDLRVYLEKRIREAVEEALEDAGYHPCRLHFVLTFIPAQHHFSFQEINDIITKVQLNLKVIVGGRVIPLRLWTELYFYNKEIEHVTDELIGTWIVKYETPNSKGNLFYFSAKRGDQFYFGSHLYSYFELTSDTSLDNVSEVGELLEELFINNVVERVIWVGRHKITLYEPAPFTVEVEDEKDGRIEIPVEFPVGRGVYLVKKLKFEHPEHGTHEIEFESPATVRVRSYLNERRFEQYRRTVNHYAAERFLKNSHL